MTAEQLQTASGLPRTEARALLAHALGVTRERLISHSELDLSHADAEVFFALVARRLGGEPLAYLTGIQEFYGRRFSITPDVLVPRPDTETLIDVALDCIRSTGATRVLELGSGSGCIAITLKLEHPELQLTATDISAAALQLARGNAAALGADISWLGGDWYGAVGAERFDLIVSNPPYVASGDPHLGALTHEPPLALTDEADGLRCLAEIIQGAPVRLRRPGWLIVEHGWDQAPEVGRLASAAGFGSVEAVRDAVGHLRVTQARW